MEHSTLIQLRLDDLQLQKLDEIAAELSTTRPGALKYALRKLRLSQDPKFIVGNQAQREIAEAILNSQDR